MDWITCEEPAKIMNKCIWMYNILHGFVTMLPLRKLFCYVNQVSMLPQPKHCYNKTLRQATILEPCSMANHSYPCNFQVNKGGRLCKKASIIYLFGFHLLSSLSLDSEISAALVLRNHEVCRYVYAQQTRWMLSTFLKRHGQLKVL